jgi:hypothetical protein
MPLVRKFLKTHSDIVDQPTGDAYSNAVVNSTLSAEHARTHQDPKGSCMIASPPLLKLPLCQRNSESSPAQQEEAKHISAAGSWPPHSPVAIGSCHWAQRSYTAICFLYQMSCVPDDGTGPSFRAIRVPAAQPSDVGSRVAAELYVATG